MVNASNGRCALTGIKFDFAPVGFGKKRPFAPSIDRVLSSAPYKVGNVRLVCVAVNVALNQWGDEVLRTVAKGMLGQLSEEEAGFRARPEARFLPGVVGRARNRSGVMRYQAYGKAKPRPKYLGSFSTEGDAYAAVLAFNTAEFSKNKTVEISENTTTD